jgi:hypothetical protein
LTVEHLQRREDHWAIVDLIDKGVIRLAGKYPERCCRAACSARHNQQAGKRNSRPHAHASVSLTTALIAPASRSQFAASFASFLLPNGVSE